MIVFLGCVCTVPDHFLSDAKVLLFLRIYTVPVQFRSSAGTKLFLFPSRYSTVTDTRYKVVPGHLIWCKRVADPFLQF